jgi:hypothetical protein
MLEFSLSLVSHQQQRRAYHLEIHYQTTSNESELSQRYRHLEGRKAE